MPSRREPVDLPALPESAAFGSPVSLVGISLCGASDIEFPPAPLALSFLLPSHKHSMSKTLAITFSLLLAVAGCGSSSKVPPVYAVSGLVTFDGKPLAGGGSIAFIPLKGQPGKTAGGTIDKEGRYTLSTHGDGDGSMAGEFRVVITQEVAQEPESVPDGSGLTPKPVETVPPADRIGKIYSDYDKSPLTANVEEKSLNEIDFAIPR